MRIVPVDTAMLAEEIGRRFALGSVSTRDLANTDRLLDLLEAHGAVKAKSAHFQNIDCVPDQGVLASATDERFWTNESFLMRSDFVDRLRRFEDRGVLAEGRTSPDEFLRCYHAEVRGRIFDIDVIMLGRTTSQLLITTHYGVVMLFEPKNGGEAERGP
jgi:hypothetical protein